MPARSCFLLKDCLFIEFKLIEALKNKVKPAFVDNKCLSIGGSDRILIKPYFYAFLIHFCLLKELFALLNRKNHQRI